MSQVIVVGSANTDLVIRANRLPRPGETVLGDEFTVSHGGKGANQAVAALKAGADAVLLAKIGRDTYGNLLNDHLVRSGLSSEGLLRERTAPGGLALIAVDPVGNNQIIVVPGSNGCLTAEDLEALGSHFRAGSLLLTQLEIPLLTVEHALGLAKARGMTTILDPAPAHPLPSTIYPVVDILTPNETEAGSLTGMEVRTPLEAEKAASILLSRGCGTVIVTLGDQGSLLCDGGKVELFPAFEVSSIDTVAAGDAFNGALAASLVEGRGLSEAVRFASAAGALSTTKRGAQESLPTREEIERLLRKHETPLDEGAV
jgi:ribokinase